MHGNHKPARNRAVFSTIRRTIRIFLLFYLHIFLGWSLLRLLLLAFSGDPVLDKVVYFPFTYTWYLMGAGFSLSNLIQLVLALGTAFALSLSVFYDIFLTNDSQAPVTKRHSGVQTEQGPKNE